MTNTKFLLLASAGFLLSGSFQTEAAVRSITDIGNISWGLNSSGSDYKLDTTSQCSNEGYTVTSCPAGKKGSGSCPYASGYYKECVCDTSVYTSSSSSQCGSLAEVESCTDDHGSYYKCTCDTTIMTTCSGGSQYASKTPSCVMNGISYFLNAECITCQSPTILNSSKTACECPSSYKECNSSNNEIGSGDSCSVGSVVKYQTCSCPAEYKECDLGPEVGAKKCTMNGITKYNNCKDCANRGTYTSCPTGYACSLEDCSKKYYITGCATGYVNLDNCSWKCMFTRIMPKN